jgi:syntaxin 5
MSDRTQELQSLLQNIAVTSGKKQNLSRPQSINTKNAFNDTASDIARGVSKTAALLTSLTNLVRNQGLFDDPTEEINSLIFKIKKDLDELNNKCDSAQSFIDSKKSIFGDNSNQSTQHNNKVVSQLKSDLMVTTKDFKGILELRTNRMKDQQQRKVELVGKSFLSPTRVIEESSNKSNKPSSGAVSGKEDPAPGSFLNNNNNPKSNTVNNNNNNLNTALTRRHNSKKHSLPNPYANPFSDSSLHSSSKEDIEENRLSSHAQQTQHLLLEPLNAENQYYDARENAVTEVEQTIGELGQLFKRLATMIQAQGEMVERIDDDVENAVSNTESGRNQLVKAYEYASSNRGLFMKLGAIAVIFILIFVLFLL